MVDRDYYAEFLAWKAKHPRLWAQVVRHALQAAQSRHRFGIKAVFERVRWYVRYEAASGSVEDFKLNNNYTAPAARYLEDHYPEIRGKFEKRRAGSDQGTLLAVGDE